MYISISFSLIVYYPAIFIHFTQVVRGFEYIDHTSHDTCSRSLSTFDLLPSARHSKPAFTKISSTSLRTQEYSDFTISATLNPNPPNGITQKSEHHPIPNLQHPGWLVHLPTPTYQSWRDPCSL